MGSDIGGMSETVSLYGLCKQYHDGEINRDALIETLSNWDYVPQEFPVPRDSIEYFLDGIYPMTTPGSFGEVEEAYDDGLLEDDVYTAILHANAYVPEE